MARYAFLVLSNPVEGQEEEFNSWYTGTHLPDVLKLDGFVAAQRFRMVESSGLPAMKHRYMAIYEAETDDPEGAYASIRAASGTEAMIISPSLDKAGVGAAFYAPITERLE
jgi:hypothetical protein